MTPGFASFTKLSDRLVELDTPCEQVIQAMAGIEKRRKANDLLVEPGELQVRLRYRSISEGLDTALDYLAQQTGHGSGLITRCLSHHVALWLDDLPVLLELQELYRDILLIAGDHNHTDIYGMVKSAVFPGRAETQKDGYFSVVGWFRDKLFDLSPVLGLHPYQLAGIGFMWSVATNTGEWLPGVIKSCFQPEVARFLRYTRERVVFFRAYRDVLGIRLEDGKSGDFGSI